MGGYYWYSDNPNCGRCGHLNGHGFCNMTACIYPVLPQTAVMTEHRLTNADHIRSMTDEELATIIFTGCVCTERFFKTESELLDWLKREATS